MNGGGIDRFWWGVMIGILVVGSLAGAASVTR